MYVQWAPLELLVSRRCTFILAITICKPTFPPRTCAPCEDLSRDALKCGQSPYGLGVISVTLLDPGENNTYTEHARRRLAAKKLTILQARRKW